MKSILCVCVLMACFAKGQYMDSLHSILNMKSSIDARAETRYGLVSNYGSTVQGLRLGVAFQRKLRIGGGISWLKTELLHDKIVGTQDHDENKTGKYTRFGYLCFYIDFVFYKTKRWQLSVPIQAGGGMLWYQNKSRYDITEGAKYGIFFYEPGITIQFKVTRWAGVGADVCYRYALKDSHVRETLNSPTLSIKTMIWFDQLFYLAFPENKITKAKGPASW